jgi:Rrf2 family protein
MMQLTKRTEYGLIALTYLALREGEIVSVREICERYPVPKGLVAQVLKGLHRSHLVDSQRGANGGYALARPAREISVGDIVAAIEGSPAITSCQSLASYVVGSCIVEPFCPIRSPVQSLRSSVWSLLQRTTLFDLAHPRANLHAS